MTQAQQLKKDNIAEYVLYMWHIEDITRAFNFDIDKIETDLINKYPNNKQEVKEWYENIIQMMEMENIKQKGHLQILKNVIIDLNNLHLFLLKSPKENEYQKLFVETLPQIKDLEQKMKGTAINDIDVCFHGLYATMLMNMKNQKISEGTKLSIQNFSKMLALLSEKYKDREKNPQNYFL